MRLTHFDAFAPVCPRCRAAGVDAPLNLAKILARESGRIRHGILHCPNPDCAREYPILDGIPVIAPDVTQLLAAQGIGLMLRDDLPSDIETLLGDAIGPDSWLDTLRQTLSTYAWDSYAAFDPAELSPTPLPGAAARCAQALLDLFGAVPSPAHALDLGCAAGGASFALAAAQPSALVLGLDSHLGLLRIAQRAAGGSVQYLRRRIGLAYDERRFAVDLPGAERVDFWAVDATALPFADASAGIVMALNLLDCLPAPRLLLAEMARAAKPGGAVLLATPFDWMARATPVAHWIGGHSQRAPHGAAGETFLRTLVSAGAHPEAIAGLAIRGERQGFPWSTRLHDRSHVAYETFLLALERLAHG